MVTTLARIARLADDGLCLDLPLALFGTDLDGHDVMNYFKRALVRQAMGSLKQALTDLAKCLELDASFGKAHERRGEIYKQLGMFDESLAALRALRQLDPSHAKAAAAEQEVLVCQARAHSGAQLATAGQFGEAANHFAAAAECATRDASLRLRRADCLERAGDLMAAIGDVTRASKLLPADLAIVLRLARMLLANGQRDEAYAKLAECLKSDETHRECKDEYKSLKKLNAAWKRADERRAQANNANAQREALVALAEALDIVTPRGLAVYVVQLRTAACSVQLALREAAAAIAECTAALAADPSYVDALLRLGDAHMLAEQYDEANRAYGKVRAAHPQNQEAARGQEHAQRMIKAASRKDYYKILGVPRSASTADINRAYRTLAREWHPDKWTDPVEKEAAEAKFHDLATGKEILTDADKRRRYDAGEDVESPQQQHHNPFQHFQQGGFTFRFN